MSTTISASGGINVINVRDFGAKGDGTTDDTAAFTAAIAAAVARSIVEVRVPAGSYKTTDTIQLMNGNSTCTVALVGECSPPYRSASAGVSIVTTFTDRPVINVQGSRNSKVKGISIKGANFSWVAGISNLAATSNRVDWLSSSIPNGLDQYRPYAGITIDAYCGSAPANPYPGTYGRAASTNVSIEDCDITGFAVGICSKPSNDDSNGDFLRIINCTISHSVYTIAICNGQSRGVSIRDCEYAYCHTALTNGYFGRQSGQFGGVIDNFSGGAAYQTFDFPTAATAGAMLFKSHYFEGQCRLGVWGGNSGFNFPLMFEGGTLNTTESASGLSPPALIETGGQGPITFNGTTFSGHKRMVNIVRGSYANCLTLRNCNFVGSSDYVSPSTPGTAAIARGLSFFGTVHPGAHDVDKGTLIVEGNRGLSWNEGTTTYGERAFGAVVDRTTSRGLVHLGASRFLDDYGRSYTIKDRRAPVALALGNAGTFTVAPAISGETLTFRYHNAKQDTNASHYRIEPGDILYFATAGTIFIVTAVAVNADTHYDVTASIMNNYTYSGGVYASTATIASETGTVWLYHTGQYIGREVYYGDFTSGSPTVANVARSGSVGGSADTYLAAGDYLCLPQQNDSFLGVPYPQGTSILSVTNGTPASVTLSKNATASKRFPIATVLFT